MSAVPNPKVATRFSMSRTPESALRFVGAKTRYERPARSYQQGENERDCQSRRLRRQESGAAWMHRRVMSSGN